MMGRPGNWFQRLPTTGKLLLILSAAILPLGLVLIWAATNGINRANGALVASADDQSRVATRAIESLIGRSTLALRIAGTAALRDPNTRGEPSCALISATMGRGRSAPTAFQLRAPDGTTICTRGNFQPQREALLLRPGQYRTWLSAGGSALYYSVGLPTGIIAGSLSREDLRDAALSGDGEFALITLSDGTSQMTLVNQPTQDRRIPRDLVERDAMLAGGQLRAHTVVEIDRVQAFDRLIILLPVLMWILAALLSWLMVGRFLIRPLRRLQRAVGAYQPGSSHLELPNQMGSATEIKELGQSFARAVERIEESEHQMAEALDGQRKLVREVHHRVKNNLQVIASLLNIHGRTAPNQDARDAYSSIGRRVDALAVVHRNHYAELEENRGIALRPLLSELAASLRASAPDTARGLNIDLDLESLNTTQDVAVATAFLVTEVVEFAMLSRPEDPVELSLRRTGDLTASFSLSSSILNPDLTDDKERQQFERIIGGLARQLRSTLDRKLGRYSVELPVFPPR